MEKTLGQGIAQRRKELGMTQAELAQKLNVTDKAVSKWERDLSCPDIGTLPTLAQVLEVSVDTLMQGKDKSGPAGLDKYREIAALAAKGVTLAMGVAVSVLAAMDRVETKSALVMLGIGLACGGICLLDDRRH